MRATSTAFCARTSECCAAAAATASGRTIFHEISIIRQSVTTLAKSGKCDSSVLSVGILLGNKHILVLDVHSVWFIRNTVKFDLVLFLNFSEKGPRPVAYLFLIFSKISSSLFLKNWKMKMPHLAQG